ncbi:DUF1120 domain-containing protein [Cedecea neteri]|uniref:DUF1120 domain-containing protein n=1 Tax=Cedecea neteri TaxID=158822 RepID=UPI0028930885|nr:DUF1120 domain-containing protein [Cedecea neteri]WNJ78480.1 DUF1120 domain-containing protein [Cedecea neteri]
MKRFNKQLRGVAALMAMASFYTHAADSVDIKVVGTISPTACTPSIAGGGTLDFGTIKTDSLDATGYTALTTQESALTITCIAPTLVGVKAIDGRPNSIAGVSASSLAGGAAAPAALNWNGYNVVGLGQQDGTTAIGGYSLYVKGGNATADNATVDVIVSEDAGHNTWSKPATLNLYGTGSTPRVLTVAATGTTSPLAFSNMTVNLGVQAYINEKAELDTSKAISLNGMTTIELDYLP